MDDEIRENLMGMTFSHKFSAYKTEKLIEMSQILEKARGSVITRQFEQSHSLYFLLKGKVSFSIRVDHNTDDFSVGESGLKFTPIGWSGFRSPYRYATTVTCQENCQLVKWKFSDLFEYFNQEPEYGAEFISFILRNTFVLINQVRTQLTNFSNVYWDIDIGQYSSVDESKGDIFTLDALSLLRTSPFFEIFTEDILSRLAEKAQKRIYMKGESIFKQGELADGLDLLVSGNVAYCFNPDGMYDKLDQEKLMESVVLRMIHYPGYVIGWTGCCENMTNDITSVATRTTVIYHIDRDGLQAILRQDMKYLLMFNQRLLWLVSNLQRNARTRLISEQFEREKTAITSLIEQNSAQLSVESVLHKLSYQLNQANTLGDAIDLLYSIEKRGDSVEKSIAKLSLDILGKIYIEYKFFNGLKKAYQSIVDSPRSLSTEEIRVKSAREFLELFEHVHYVIRGWENLPEEPGHIFIYNHLANNHYYTLPNGFQMSLDSNFIKSVILYRKYNKPGIGVVRVPKAVEYAHQNYYQRLGHIYVYTSQSELSEENQAEQKEVNKQFYEKASEYLLNGENLMISPEGRSYRTKESPGEFKPGAFRLAAGMNSEPLIVPVAIANFDKRVKNNVFSVVIKKPFRISEFVDDPLINREGLSNFLEEYRKTYHGYIKEALMIAKREASEKINLRELIPVNKVA
jgi:CRP-like cAMP-binding protein